MLSSGFIKKVLKKVQNGKVSEENIKKILFDVQKDRELYESIFESIIEGVIVLDENNKVQYVNNTALNLFELELKNVIDRNISEIFDNKGISDLFIDLNEAGNKILNKEIEIGHFDESTVIRMNVFPLKKKSSVIGTIIMLLDITANKREQNKLRRAESLASLTTLAAGVAHEIKNPLSSIDIHIQLMERMIEELPKKQREKFRNMSGIISEEIDRLNRIVSDFLFSVRPTILDKKLVNLEKLFHRLLELVSLKAKEKGVRFTLKVEQNFPEVVCDPNYIRNALLNIVKNSIEACNEDNEIIITIHRESNNAIIKISDTGKGIPKDKLNKIFEPYFTTKDFGTGLGLTIVYKIIKEHDGDISVSSTEGKGTIFKITLPVFGDKVKLLEK
jgi:two-component system, sporulation sensor kinase E